MVLKEAITLFHMGAILKMEVEYYPFNIEKWALKITTQDSDQCYLSSYRDDIKGYKTLDSAIQDVERITGRVQSLEVKP